MCAQAVVVLLATYNGEKYLNAQIDSLLTQKFQNFKVYISDDSSTDSTVKIINEYCDLFPSKILLISKGIKYGSAKKNFLTLLNQVKADIYFFCDQDDIWTEDHISSMLDVYNRNTAMNNLPYLIHSDLLIVNNKLDVICDSYFKYSNMLREKVKNNYYYLQNNVTGCSMMINNALKELALLASEWI